jgi:hypothetical protein
MRVTALVVCAAVCVSASVLAQDTQKKAAAPAKKAAGSAKAAPGDAALIKAAMSAAPASISKEATIVAMSDDMKSTRTLRKGTNGYSCMPAPDPMCADQNAMAWFDAYMNKKDPPKDKIGFVYMLAGDHGASNTDPYAQKETPANNWIKTGPHVMIVGAKGMMAGYPNEAKADPTKAYVMWPGTAYEHLMLPVK